MAYSAIGRGGGIAQITARTVDFGASDAPLTEDQFKEATKEGSGVVQIPWALGSVVAVYHVEGAPNHLRLTGPVLAEIYEGKITAWNDPKIAALNPGVTLPSTKITPVYRSDGSGDTYAFTDYLSKVSPEWKSSVGNATQVKFPAGVGAKGSSGISATVSSTNGSIGYLTLAYVLQGHLDRRAHPERRRQLSGARRSLDRSGREDAEGSPIRQRDPHRGSACVGAGSLPDLDLHLCAGTGEVAEGEHTEAIPEMGRHDRAEVRPEARVRADPGTGPCRR